RVLDRPLPQVSLIDLRRERPGQVYFSALSPTLERAVRVALRDDGQVMLLLNRRGFSTHVHCPSCGYVEACRFCDLTLTYHPPRDVMLCHYCSYEQPPPDRCPQCGGPPVRYEGLGTEKLQAEIEEKFAGYVVRRMDSDTMKRPGSHARVLKAFRNGLIHILLGTQMIAKGLDFPNVTLVGVVNADVGLHFPDFRAGERTFQLLSQVAGRTGRGPRGGRGGGPGGGPRGADAWHRGAAVPPPGRAARPPALPRPETGPGAAPHLPAVPAAGPRYPARARPGAGRGLQRARRRRLR